MTLNQYLRIPDEPKICECCKDEVDELYDGICLDCHERFKLLTIQFVNISSNEEFLDYAIEHIDEILEV